MDIETILYTMENYIRSDWFCAAVLGACVIVGLMMLLLKFLELTAVITNPFGWSKHEKTRVLPGSHETQDPAGQTDQD